MRDNPLKQKLARGERALGVWCGLGTEVSVEVAGRLGYDWVLLDCEHGLIPTERVISFLRAASGSDLACIVRIPSVSEPSSLKRVLDMGADGVLLPLVRTAREVQTVISECRYPPAGQRGIASQRAHGYGTDFIDTFRRSNDEVLVIAQIETREALAELDAIAQTPGLDALFVGPADLSAALGAPFDTTSSAFQEAIDRVLAACKTAGKPAGIYCHGPEDAKTWLARGFAFANVCNDQSALVRAMTEALAAARG